MYLLQFQKRISSRYLHIQGVEHQYFKDQDQSISSEHGYLFLSFKALLENFY